MGIKNQVLTILFFWALLPACGPAKKLEKPPVMDVETKRESFPRTDLLFADIINSQPQFHNLLSDEHWKDVQIIYTMIDRDSKNQPHFKTYYFNFDPAKYFYPASTVKLPTALVALQKLRALSIPGLATGSTMITASGYSGQSAVYNDPTSEDGRPTIAQYIRKILLVSDNDAFNRLYEFVGQEYLNGSLHSMDLDSAQIIHRLEVFLSEDENRHTNPIWFLDENGKQLYSQPVVNSFLKYLPRQTFRGKGFMRKGVLVNEPFNFSSKNRLNLNELHQVVQSVMFPAAMPIQQRFKVHDSDLAFVRKYMSMYPAESTFPSYDSSYNDSYVKFLYYGSTDAVDPNIRIFNKVGDAYGFLTDAAYFADFKNGVEFILSATIHCNSDGIYNDNKYDYETVGLPFMRLLGREIYKRELNRKKQRLPDLSAFRFNYKE
jgi:hypothetical protein